MKVHALRGDSSPFVQAIAGAGDRVGADVVVECAAVMTVRGTVDKTAVLLGLVVASAVGAWRLLATSPAPLLTLVLVGLVGGLVVALVTTAKPDLAPATAPIYAILEGLVLGSLSWVTATELSQGVVTLAVGATFATLAAMLFAYRTGLIRPTATLRQFVVTAMGAILIIYFGGFVLAVSGMDTSVVFGGGPVGILVSLFVIAVAALNLILDFEFIEDGSRLGLDKHFEWYGAFGLVVTLVWIYLEILRLLAEISGDDS